MIRRVMLTVLPALFIVSAVSSCESPSSDYQIRSGACGPSGGGSCPAGETCTQVHDGGLSGPDYWACQ